MRYIQYEKDSTLYIYNATLCNYQQRPIIYSPR